MREIFTEEIKYQRSEAVPCDLCKKDICTGHRIKLSWYEPDPNFPNKVWIDGVVRYEIDDNEASSICYLKVNFPQNGPGEIVENK